MEPIGQRLSRGDIMRKHIAELLRSIHQKKSTISLVEKGLLYHQIARLIGEALDQYLIEYSENGVLRLTDAGYRYLFDSNSRDGEGQEGWIEPLDDMRIPNLGPFDIYIPRRRVLSKLRKH